MATGRVSTYDLTVGVKLNIEDMIWLVSPFDVPLLGTNGADGRTTLASETCFEKKVEWLDETLLTPRSTLAAQATTGDAYITVASGDQLKYQTGDVLLVDSEYMRITDYGTTADTLLVTRAYSGSAATHVTSVAVLGVGAALPEGGDPPNARSLDRTNRFNYTQIFGPAKVEVSGTENAIQKYGIAGSEFDHQVANRTKELLVGMEQAILYGVRAEDTTNKWRTMGGFNYWITTNVDSSTTTLTEAALLAQLQTCYDAGGAPDRVITGSKQKRVISAINTSAIRYTQDTNVRGQVVDFYDSDFGRQSVVLDRWCRTSDVFIFGRDQAVVNTLRPMQFEMLAKTGDAVKGEILAEKTMKLHRQSWAAKFTALT